MWLQSNEVRSVTEIQWCLKKDPCSLREKVILQFRREDDGIQEKWEAFSLTAVGIVEIKVIIYRMRPMT